MEGYNHAGIYFHAKRARSVGQSGRQNYCTVSFARAPPSGGGSTDKKINNVHAIEPFETKQQASLNLEFLG